MATVACSALLTLPPAVLTSVLSTRSGRSRQEQAECQCPGATGAFCYWPATGAGGGGSLGTTLQLQLANPIPPAAGTDEAYGSQMRQAVRMEWTYRIPFL